MFAGIVEEIGTIGPIMSRTGTSALHIRCQTVMEGTRIGDSIAVNGVCLTVTNVRDDGFTADLQPVTQRLSNLGGLSIGDAVNLERSVGVGERFGGHYVQGHIDGTAHVVNIAGEGPSLVVRLGMAVDLLRYVVERGFITVDGASLTVMRLWPDGAEVSLVYHTQHTITLSRKRAGDRVNIEVDVFAKYVERLTDALPGVGGDISMDFLHRNGFA
jgi:riboflavin synthase